MKIRNFFISHPPILIVNASSVDNTMHHIVVGKKEPQATENVRELTIAEVALFEFEELGFLRSLESCIVPKRRYTWNMMA
jgi:hypothetical protein